MPIELISQNSVVVANHLNPSIFTVEWCAAQDLIPLGAMKPGTIVSPALVQFLTDDFNLLVVPDRVQIVPLASDEATHGELVRRVLGGIVNKLPHTPYTAAGINFHYFVRYDDRDFATINRNTLVHPTVFSPFFQGQDARFGAYYSQDYFGARLKLEIRPAHQSDDPSKQFWRFEFNFHKEVNREKATAEVSEFLTQWENARGLALKIVQAVEEQ